MVAAAAIWTAQAVDAASSEWTMGAGRIAEGAREAQMPISRQPPRQAAPVLL